jgi:topoisomerase-4 subunit A
MGRGKGVRLQKYNMARGRQGTLELDGGLSDLTTFTLAEGLTWAMPNGQTRREAGIADWVVKRGSVGKAPPHGFPRDNRFT